MWNSLSLIHSSTAGRSSKVLTDYFLWQTCMRNVYVSDLRLLSQSPLQFLEEAAPLYQTYEGYDAYAFLLEVSLGLHSEILGETEVFHQFRKAFQEAALAPVALQPYLQKLCRDITVDARKIRAKYMHGLGELSYGGAARRLLKGRKHIVIFGTGQLAYALLPWLLKGCQNLQVFGRNPEQLQAIQKNFEVCIGQYSDICASSFNAQSALVIAAPLSLEPYFGFIKKGICILDFRQTEEEQLNGSVEYYPLKSILAQIRQSRSKRQQLLWRLKPALARTIQERKQTAYQSVHSWEDITHLQVL